MKKVDFVKASDPQTGWLAWEVKRGAVLRAIHSDYQWDSPVLKLSTDRPISKWPRFFDSPKKLLQNTDTFAQRVLVLGRVDLIWTIYRGEKSYAQGIVIQELWMVYHSEPLSTYHELERLYDCDVHLIHHSNLNPWAEFYHQVKP